jgi:hypothetical protein
MWSHERIFCAIPCRLHGPILTTPKGTPLVSPQLKQGVLRGGGDKYEYKPGLKAESSWPSAAKGHVSDPEHQFLS